MLKIGDFSRLTQVSIKTLRYYDKIGLLKPAEIDQFTGYRYYTLDQMSRLTRILVLKDLGFPLESIAHMLDDDLTTNEIRQMLQLKQVELQQQVEEAQARLGRVEIHLRQIEMEDKMPDHEVVIKRVEAQQVLYIRQIIPTIAGVRPLLDEIDAALREHDIKGSAPLLIMYHHAGYRDTDLDVEVAIPVDASTPDGVILPDGRQMGVRIIPAIDTVAAVLLQGSYDEFSSVYRTLSTHIHAHGFNYLGPAREIYLRAQGDTNDPAEYLTEIQYPVGEFKDSTAADGIELPTDWEANRSIHLPLSRRARTALEFAKAEAVALQNSEITPVHLLIGLLRDSDGFAGQVLAGLGVTIEQVRTVTAHGKSQSTTPTVLNAARQVMLYANQETRQLGHDYIGTEHLLLGLTHQKDSAVVDLLAAGEVNAEQVRAAVLRIMNQ